MSFLYLRILGERIKDLSDQHISEKSEKVETLSEIQVKVDAVQNFIPNLIPGPYSKIFRPVKELEEAVSEKVKKSSQNTRVSSINLRNMLAASALLFVVGRNILRNNSLDLEYDSCINQFGTTNCAQFRKQRMDSPMYINWKECNTIENSTDVCNKFLGSYVWVKPHSKPTSLYGTMLNMFECMKSGVQAPVWEWKKLSFPVYWDNELYVDWNKCKQNSSIEECLQKITISDEVKAIPPERDF